MDREKQIEEMAKVMYDMPFKCDTCKYTYDIYFTERKKCQSMKDAERVYNAGYRKHSEVITEFAEAVKHIADGVKFKNATEKIAFIEMLEDLAKMKGGVE